MELELLIEVAERLEKLGFEAPEKIEDLDFYADLVFHVITMDINRDYIPHSLHNIYIDMICGEFLYEKFLTGGLDYLFNKMPDPANITSVKVGDVSVGVSNSTSSKDNLLNFITDLKDQPKRRYLFDYERCAYV